MPGGDHEGAAKRFAPGRIEKPYEPACWRIPRATVRTAWAKDMPSKADITGAGSSRA